MICMTGQMLNMVQETGTVVWEIEETGSMEELVASQDNGNDGALDVWFDLDGTTYHAQTFQKRESPVISAPVAGDSGPSSESGPGVGAGSQSWLTQPGAVLKLKVEDPGELMLPDTEFTRYNASENRKNEVIMIDPGHGNPSVASLVPNFTDGAYFGGRSDQLHGETEEVFALAVGEKIRDKLLAAGYDVIMSRDTNDALTPNKLRAKMASEAGCILQVCIHWNASGRSDMNGTLKVVPPDYNSRSWLWEIEQLWSICGPRLGAHLGSRVQSDYIFPGAVFGVDVDLPILYIETGFMTGSVDRNRLTGEENHEAIAEAIASGIIEYYDQKKGAEQ